MTEQQPNPAKRQRNRIISAIRGQQQEIATLQRQNEVLRSAVFTLASAAGVGNHPRFASLRTAADGGNDPDGAPATTTEQAKQPQATDDVENIGSAPGSANDGVTPDAVTDVNNSNVSVADKPLLDNMQDVTKPVGGVEPPKGESAHVETEIRVSQPNNDVMDPAGSTGWKSTSSADQQERFITALRLARLRATAGIDTSGDDDTVIAQRLATSAATLGEMQAEERALAAVASRRQASAPPRHLVPREASQRGVVPHRAPSLVTQSSVGDPSDAEFMFGMDGLAEG